MTPETETTQTQTPPGDSARPRPPPAPPRSPVKPPERCPHCCSPKIAAKGSRRKKLETVRIYDCRACGRRFTPGPRALRAKTYPVGEILDAITAWNRGNSLEEVARRLSSRYGHAISPSTISRWLSAHAHLTTYRRLREKGRGLFSPPRLIRMTKLYHAQVYEFGCHRAKLAFLREGSLDDRRAGDRRFAPLADFLENVPQTCPHELFRRDDGARASSLPAGFLSLDRLTVIEKTNTATDAAALIIPGVASNRDRHSRLQRFMLANDSTTIAVEVPIWLDENEIAALERKYRITIVPRQPVDPACPAAGHKSRLITGHIDFLQARNGAIHILDYKPDARTNPPRPQQDRARPAGASSLTVFRNLDLSTFLVPLWNFRYTRTMINRDDNRQPSIVARYEAAKATAHDLGFQLSVTPKAPRLFVLEENGSTVLTFADVANIDAFLHGFQDARRRRRNAVQQRRHRGAKTRSGRAR